MKAAAKEQERRTRRDAGTAGEKGKKKIVRKKQAETFFAFSWSQICRVLKLKLTRLNYCLLEAVLTVCDLSHSKL